MPATATPTKSAAAREITTVDQFLRTIKLADNVEPGSIGGDTAHPVKSVDDRTEPAVEGARSKENSEDVKKDQGAPSVDSTPAAKAAAARKQAEGAVMTPGSAASDQLQIGTEKKPTGEDPSVETESAKGGKEDSDTSHPARTDNDALQGGKFAYDHNTPLEKMAADLQSAGEVLCASLVQIAQGAGNTKAAEQAQAMSNGKAPAPVPAPAKEAAAAPPPIDPNLAAQLGWEMAGLVTGNFDKRAADVLVHNTLAQVVKEASYRADLVINFLTDLETAHRAKQAEEGLPPEMGGGMPPGAPPGAGGGGGPDEEALLAALSGGSGGPAAGDAGGGPGGEMSGSGGEGGGDDQEQKLMMLEALLDELGIDPAQLAGGDAGGGDPSGSAGGGDAGGGAPPPVKEGSAKKPVTRPAPKTAGEQRDYLRELLARSQKRRSA
jgi:hypothetical protein